jgi:hypothetical protein
MIGHIIARSSKGRMWAKKYKEICDFPVADLVRKYFSITDTGNIGYDTHCQPWLNMPTGSDFYGIL